MPTQTSPQTDIRIKQLSYSSRLTLHACPRKYQLYRLNAKEQDNEDTHTSVTFAFGTVVGIGIQAILQDLPIETAVWQMYLAWEPHLQDENPKQKKSFWIAVAAVEKFYAMRQSGFLDGYTLLSYNGAPAVELPFIITFPDGFTYKGYVDAVMQNTETGEVIVVEVKTTSSTTLHPAQYKNSAQAVGYSIVLDALPGLSHLSSYSVYYVVYKTKDTEYEVLPFEKSYLSRALWIKSILLDVEMIKMYEEAGVYPMHGEACLEYYRECEYFNLCTLDTAKLIEPLTPETEQSILDGIADFKISLTLNDLIDAQLRKEMQ